MTTLRFVRTLGASLALLAGVGLVHAQTAGTWMVRGGVTQIKPDVTSGDLSSPAFFGTKADVDAATQVSAGLTYMYSDHLAVDLPIVFQGFKHDILGAGAIANTGKIGEVRALPITLLAQYRFGEAHAFVRPYVGAGLTYAKFFKGKGTAALSGLTGGTPTNPTSLNVDSKFAPTLQLGMSMAVSGPWGLDVAVTKSKLKTRTTLTTGQTLDITLDPWSFMVGATYAF